MQLKEERCAGLDDAEGVPASGPPEIDFICPSRGEEGEPVIVYNANVELHANPGQRNAKFSRSAAVTNGLPCGSVEKRIDIPLGEGNKTLSQRQGVAKLDYLGIFANHPGPFGL